MVKSSAIAFPPPNATVSSLFAAGSVSARQTTDALALDLNGSKPKIAVCFQREFICSDIPFSIVPEADGEAWVVEGTAILFKDSHGETSYSYNKTQQDEFR